MGCGIRVLFTESCQIQISLMNLLSFSRPLPLILQSFKIQRMIYDIKKLSRRLTRKKKDRYSIGS